MGLSDDQKAILRLLSQRGEQGYEDLAALMGIGVDEVHERALAAAAQLEAEGIPAPRIPEPPAAPDGAPKPPAPVETPKPAPPVPASPAEPAPSAPEPAAPKPAPTSEPIAKPTPTPKRAGPHSRPKLSLPKSGGARAAIAAGTAVVVLLIVILALGGGDSDDPPSGSNTAAAEETAANPSNPKLTQAALSPIDGSDAQGLATFGRVKNRLALQVEAQGLEPTGNGESYTIWLYESADKMLPLASTAVGDSGKIGAQVEVPTEVLGYLANETFGQIDISLTSNATLKASLAKATKEKEAPIYTGTDVLRGEITGPIIGAAKKTDGE
jgi:hypothetical protein